MLESYFRSHVDKSANVVFVARMRSYGLLSKAEVDDLDSREILLISHEHVRCLHVAMDNTLIVNVIDSTYDSLHDLGCLDIRQLSFLGVQVVVQASALE